MKIIRNVTLFYIVLFAVQIICGYAFIYHVTTAQATAALQAIVNRIQNDHIYDNGVWNTALYNSDPGTPYYNAPSSYPLYVLTSDGFIIERSKPVKGLLDSSDFKHLIAFQTPRTINTVTNEKWRVLSLPINADKVTIGVITVAFFNPEDALLSEVDKRLNDSISQISSQLQTNNTKIDSTKLDIRDLRYDITFEVVDKYNKVVASHGRTPSFIDPSYVVDALQQPTTRIVKDAETHESFLVMSSKIQLGKNAPAGIIVAGQSLNSATALLNKFTIYSTIASLIALVPLVVISSYFVSMYKAHTNEVADEKVKSISFNKKDGVLNINDKKIELPPNSYQLTMCAALFSAPTKKWRQEQIFSRFGDPSGPKDIWRTVYDASLAINRKAGIKLVMYKDRMYFINPDLQEVTSII